jgi:aminoglycoside phosphotransferase family enzyme/predicted kinase
VTQDPEDHDKQSEVIAFLSEPSSYPGRVGAVVRHETHGAMVFLAGDEAIKIKRAVRLPYLDFSTLEKRRRVCLRELEINRRFAPDLYLGCVAITRGEDGKLQLGGTGEAVEWAVRMRRFDDGALMSRIAEEQGIPASLARDLADTVWASHQAAEPRPAGDAAGRLARLIEDVSGNLAGLEAIPAAEATRLGDGLRRHLAACAVLIGERAAAGFLRRCHGDLHLGNLVLWEGRPTLFDALEFDDELATIDTLYDLAFLLMDLDCRGQRPAANVVLNRYLWHSGAELDLKGLRALPLFLALRSAVRAMVAAERAVQKPAGERSAETATARRYLDAALGYLAPVPPRLVAVGGLSGTGKSTLAAALAPALGPAPGAVHLRSDLERKRMAGAAETERLPASWYTRAVSDRVYATLCSKARLVLDAGHAAIVDAVYSTPEERAGIEAAARSLGLPVAGLWLSAPAETLMARVGARRGDASDATPDVVRLQLERPTGTLGPAWFEIDASGEPANVLARAAEVLRQRLP